MYALDFVYLIAVVRMCHSDSVLPVMGGGVLWMKAGW